jgi:tRNA threonylcarbamoyladenosine biosynthesis protein TsaB
VFYGLYRQVPGGVQRISPHRVARPEQLCWELQATGEECLAVGDGALRYATALHDLQRVEIGDAGLAHPSAASLVQLAHAQALREDFVKPSELQPVYLRQADAAINWDSRAR